MSDKKYIMQQAIDESRERDRECICMLNGLEKTLERKLSAEDRRWHVSDATGTYEYLPAGFPSTHGLLTPSLQFAELQT